MTASVTVESVKQEFKGIGGGYVFLNTSDLETQGIARLCFGNPYRKNAIRNLTSPFGPWTQINPLALGPLNTEVTAQ